MISPYKKNSHLLTAEALIHHQIAQAHQESKLRTVHRLSMEVFDDEPISRSADMAQEHFRKAQSQSAALSSADPVMKNEIVEKYLQSQNELRTKMERQYQDAITRKEIILEPEPPTPPPPTTSTSVGTGQEVETKKKKKRDKKKNKDPTVVFPSESEILSRLPPIDPQILEELKNFQFYVQPELEDQAKSKPDNETEISTSLTSPETKEESKEVLIGSKIDWGDSEDEDDFVQVASKDAVDSSSMVTDHNGNASAAVGAATSSYLTDITATVSSEAMEVSIDEKDDVPVEITDADVDKLHLEKVENLNGNLDKDNEFKEWHEVLTVKSFNEDLLHILPYTIIDF